MCLDEEVRTIGFRESVETLIANGKHASSMLLLYFFFYISSAYFEQAQDAPEIKKQRFHVAFHLVGMTGFEPATPRPPGVCANRAAPHPETDCKNNEYRPFNKCLCLFFNRQSGRYIF